jgi:hypothetical protein
MAMDASVVEISPVCCWMTISYINVLGKNGVKKQMVETMDAVE